MVINLTPSMFASLQRLYTARHTSSSSYNGQSNDQSNQHSYPSIPMIQNRSKNSQGRINCASFGLSRNQQSPNLQAINLSESSSSSNAYSNMLSLNDINNYFSSPSTLLGQSYLKDQNSGPANPKYQSSTVAANVWSVPSTVVTDMSPMADVKFSSLPFYEELAVITQPTNLLPTSQIPSGRPSMQEFTIPFTLSVDHANLISTSRKLIPVTDAFSNLTQPRVEFDYMILIRFALSNIASRDKIVDDTYPPSLLLKINSKPVTLPPSLPVNKLLHKETWKPARPVDLTPLIKISPTSPNTVLINWCQPTHSYNPNIADITKRYVFTIHLVKKVNCDELTGKIKSKGIKSSEFTKSIIMDKLRDEDTEIATTFLRASLQCPLGKMRLRSPGRSINCVHIQCFDLNFFIQMNEKKPTWLCPICDKKIAFDSLVVDGLFTDILASELANDTNEIQFIKNNDTIEWSPVIRKDVKSQINKSDDHGNNQSDKRKADNENSSQNNEKSKKKKPECEIITIDSDDETEPDDNNNDDDDDDDNDNETTSRRRSSSCHQRQVEMLNVSDDDSLVTGNQGRICFVSFCMLYLISPLFFYQFRYFNPLRQNNYQFLTTMILSPLQAQLLQIDPSL